MRWNRLFVTLMAFSLFAAACGDDDSTTADEPAADEPAADEPADEPAAEPAAEKVSVAILLPCAINDLSWCQAAYEGVKQLMMRPSADWRMSPSWQLTTVSP